MLWATVFYTVVGTVGALVVGLFAALLLVDPMPTAATVYRLPC